VSEFSQLGAGFEDSVIEAPDFIDVIRNRGRHSEMPSGWRHLSFHCLRVKTEAYELGVVHAFNPPVMDKSIAFASEVASDIR